MESKYQALSHLYEFEEEIDFLFSTLERIHTDDSWFNPSVNIVRIINIVLLLLDPNVEKDQAQKYLYNCQQIILSMYADVKINKIEPEKVEEDSDYDFNSDNIVVDLFDEYGEEDRIMNNEMP